MHLLNFNVDRIIIHQVYQRDHDGNKVTPTQSHEYTNFEHSAMTAFKTRVKDALGDGSGAVQMEIVDQGDRDLPMLVENMISQDDDAFAVSSYDLANALTDAQQTRAIPGGILVVFTGTYGNSDRNFLGLIKAEVHSGYEKEVNERTGEISLKFVEEILLTPGTRLYKTAAFFEKNSYNPDYSNLNDKWVVMVSDYQISKSDGKAAAKYFYSDFLGCGYPETSARTTKKFYEATHDFIDSLDASEIEKSNLFTALITYLKVNRSSTVSSAEFAERYFEDIDIQDTYTGYMNEQGLPNTAFTKDNEHIQSKLKFRKVRFRGNVEFKVPADKFSELITMESIEGDQDQSGERAEWTKIIVKDRIITQE